MAPPKVTIYVTSLTSQPRIRQYTELLHRSLKGLEIPYESFDLVMDTEAKTRWQRAKPPGQVIGLPGFLVGGEFVGTMEDFEQAVEEQNLPIFLKQDYDLGSTSETGTGAGPSGGVNASGSIQEAELEKLMREMTDGDLDKLAGELGVEAGGGVGLIVPAGEGLGEREDRVGEGAGAGAGEDLQVGGEDVGGVPPGGKGSEGGAVMEKGEEGLGGLADKVKGVAVGAQDAIGAQLPGGENATGVTEGRGSGNPDAGQAGMTGKGESGVVPEGKEKLD